MIVGWITDSIKKKERKEAENQHSSLSASCFGIQYSQLPSIYAIMTSLPWCTVPLNYEIQQTLPL